MNSLKTMKFEDFNDVNNYRLRTNDNTPWLLFFKVTEKSSFDFKNGSFLRIIRRI